MTARRRESKAGPRDVLAQIDAFCHDDRGANAVEYGLLAALVVAVVIVALTQVRANLLSLPFPTLIAAFVEALS